MLVPFEGRHSENLHALSLDEIHTQFGKIHQITVMNIWLLRTSVGSPDMEHKLLLAALASGLSGTGFPESPHDLRALKSSLHFFPDTQCADEKYNAIVDACSFVGGLLFPTRAFKDFFPCCSKVL